MNEKKISLSTFLLIIAIILICLMGYYIYTISQKNQGSETITKEIVKMPTHEEIMKSLYLSKNFKENSNEYDNYIGASIYGFSVQVDEEGIFLDITDKDILWNYCDKDTYNCEISGITEEVVDIKLFFGSTPAPIEIIFLTREGNTYALSVEDAIHSDRVTAQKVENVADIIKIDILDCLPEDAMEGTQAVMAIKSDGSYEDITEKIFL